MPRSASVILTPTEKKVKTAELKASVKSAGVKVKDASKELSALVKQFNADAKQVQKDRKAVDIERQREFDAAHKKLKKQLAEATKEQNAAQTALAKLNPNAGSADSDGE